MGIWRVHCAVWSRDRNLILFVNGIGSLCLINEIEKVGGRQKKAIILFAVPNLSRNGCIFQCTKIYKAGSILCTLPRSYEKCLRARNNNGYTFEKGTDMDIPYEKQSRN